MAVFARVLAHLGLLKAIQEQVRFARARIGTYDPVDFLVVLIGYALSGEATLQAFYERLAPFAEIFMALFGRSRLPDRSTLSRFLAALDQTTVEALRTLFLADLVARTPFATQGSLSDRQGNSWWVMDIDGTKQAAPPTRPAAWQGSSCASSPVESGLGPWLHGTQTRGGREDANHHFTSLHPSMDRHLLGCRQWKVSQRIETRPGVHYLVCNRSVASPFSD